MKEKFTNIWRTIASKVVAPTVSALKKLPLVWKIIYGIVVLLFVAVIVTVCVKGCADGSTPVSGNTPEPGVYESSTPEPDTVETPDADATPSPEPTEEPTAEPTEDPDDSAFAAPDFTKRPYMFTIDNEGLGCLPQGGLSKAPFIYEVVVENAETRLLALVWDVAGAKIGPVRSARHYMIDYAMEWNSLYVAYGWSPRAKDDLLYNFSLNFINGVYNDNGRIFKDITGNVYNWQDSYAVGDEVIKFFEDKGISRDNTSNSVFTYSDETIVPDGRQAINILLPYSTASGAYNCGFTWDSENEVYLRWRMGSPHIDRYTEQQLTATNIIIQKVKNYTISGDTSGRQELDRVGSGYGWYITGGKAVQIKWSKTSRGAQTVYTDLEDKPIQLNEGPTWIEIYPTYMDEVIE